MTGAWSELRTTAEELGRRVRRAWPRSETHLLVELSDGTDTLVGQWFADADTAATVAAQTPFATLVDDGRSRGRLVLQGAGADRRIGTLMRLLSAPSTELISHRPERRAVVRRGGDQAGYWKLVPSRRLSALAASARRAAALPVRTPAVLGVDEAMGGVVTAPLPGRPVAQWLSGPDGAAASRAVGAALAAVHRLSADGLTPHGCADESAVTRRWETWAAAWGADGADMAVDQPGQRRLDPDSLGVPPAPTQPSLVHRDFHDGQVLVDDDLAVGIIDFDLMAAGDPAVDVANFISHLRLRERQGGAPAAPLSDAFLSGYDPDDRLLSAVPFYLATSRRRLAAVYAFRDPSLPS